MRNISTPALIISVKIQGESDRRVTAFSPDEGIFFATLYGGPKSRLRSLVSPMNRGIIYLYRDEAKKQTKITDFDVRDYHISFRESLFKTYAASFAAEILIKTRCAGSPGESWRILNGFLDGIEASGEDESRLGLVRFLWRYLFLLGVRPDTAFCVSCGSPFHAGHPADDSPAWRCAFSDRESGFVCPECLSEERDGELVLSKAALTYLDSVSNLSPKTVRGIAVSGRTLSEMRRLTYFLIERACDSKLNSLRSGAGIL